MNTSRPTVPAPGFPTIPPSSPFRRAPSLPPSDDQETVRPPSNAGAFASWAPLGVREPLRWCVALSAREDAEDFARVASALGLEPAIAVAPVGFVVSIEGDETAAAGAFDAFDRCRLAQ